MNAGFVFATLSAGADRLWVSSSCFLDPGPNCTVVLNQNDGTGWTATRICQSGDPRLIAALKKKKKSCAKR